MNDKGTKLTKKVNLSSSTKDYINYNKLKTNNKSRRSFKIKKNY